jgi:ceramide glucosyltransferase
MSVLQTLAALIWGLALTVTAVGTWITLRRLSATPKRLDAPFGLYPVSILKPVKGVEPDLKTNLESFFYLDYPYFELLFCVPTHRDPAVKVIEALIAKHPWVNARLFVEEQNIGPNPKVNNLIRAYELATYDWILVSDSNVLVPPEYLKRLVAHLDPGVGMITSVVAGRYPRKAGGELEATFLNTWYARWMCIAEAAGKTCVVGKSMLFRRSVAERFGGMRNLARYLAEDYMAGEAMQRLGLKVIIASDPICQVIGKYEFKTFWLRHLRWGRIRKAQAPLAFAFEPLSGSIISGLLGAWALSGSTSLTGMSFSQFLVVHLTLWSACDFLQMRKLNPELRWTGALAWFARELLALPLWAHIASGNTVNWRGNKLRIQSGGTLAEEPSN